MASLNKATGKYIIKRFPAAQWPGNDVPNWKRFSFDTLAEAEAYETYALDFWRAGGEQPGVDLGTGDFKLGRVIDEFLRYCRVSDKTLKSYEYHLSKVAEWFGRDTNINHIDHKMLRDYFHNLEAKGLSDGTLNSRLVIIKMVWKGAKIEGVLNSMPVFPKALRNKQTRLRYLTDAEEKALLDAMPSEQYYYLTKFLLYTGLRVSEALRIRPCDRAGDVLQVVGKGSKLRAVPLGDTALSCLDTRKKPGDRYFPHNYRAYATVFARAREKAGLKDVVIHTLRHTTFSRLAMKDVGVNKIQALAGHSDIATTQRYMHLAPSYLGELADIIG